ncbi:GerAB/ArcD/ProY family transporter [Paenibacillus humicola]|uniref:GerAB/ArcD/ProY family transporter n=1 Tax=Paenibacillus humicola TaxID=3110540 RepID=UPI00237A405A|nr:endospore germination permease [Paenibacillus humicola]
MKWFEYGNNLIGPREVSFSVSSIIVGVGILTMPRLIAESTESSDGWISIAIAGAAAVLFGWILAKFCVLLQDRGFYAVAAELVSAPAAAAITVCISLYFMLYCAYEVRAIANISKQYIFDRTPVEYIALAFLLVVAYAVSGSREGIIRLNMLFLPLVIVIALAVLIFSIGIFDYNDLKPFFITDWHGITKGALQTMSSMLGFEAILFYSTMMEKPKKAPQAVVVGLLIPVLFYLVIYMICVGVFTHQALMEITYPVIELAKEAQIPGEFFERFESLFFTIWIMTIFNTACMAFDVTVYALGSILKRVGKMTWILILCPTIYLACMLPRNLNEFEAFGMYMTYFGAVAAVLVPCLLYALAKLRGVKP